MKIRGKKLRSFFEENDNKDCGFGLVLKFETVLFPAIIC